MGGRGASEPRDQGGAPENANRRMESADQQMVHSGEMAAETADHLVKERQKRAEAEYVPLTEGTETRSAPGMHARAASLRRRGGTC